MKKNTLTFSFLLFSVSLFSQTKVKLDAVLWSDYISNKWTNSVNDTYAYNSHGQKIENTTYNWSTAHNKWIESQRYYYSYISDSLPSETRYQIFDTQKGQWRDSSLTSYSHNDDHYLIEMVIQTQSSTSSSLSNAFKELYTPDSNGNNKEIIAYLWNTELNKWEESVKEEMQYNSYGNLSSYNSYVWDDLLDIWVNYEKGVYSYSNDNKIINYTYQKWDEYSETWENNFKDYTETYEENGEPKLRYLSYDFDETRNNWVFYSREFHTLKEDGRLLNYKEDSYNTTRRQWDYYDLEQYTYDPENNLTLFLDQDKHSTFNRWVNNTKEEMDYTTSVKTESLVLPFSDVEIETYFSSQLNSILLSEWNGSQWQSSQKAIFSYSEFNTTSSKLNFANNSLQVYPNPASEVINVLPVPEFGEYSLELFAINGNKVFEIEANGKVEIPLFDIPKGVYLLKTTSTTGYSDTRKVVVK